MESALISQRGRIYRALLGGNHYTIRTAQGLQDIPRGRAERLPDTAPHHCAFDEWPTLTRDQKAACIRAAVFRNPQMGWAPGAMERLIDNMHVFDHCVLETSIVIRLGIKHYSVRVLMEVARHKTTLQMIDTTYKINNNLAPDVARLLTALFPEIPHRFFEFRNNHKRGAIA